jgi:hypothetical protein
MHADQADQLPLLPSQLRVCVPQLPQLRLASPLQTWPLQTRSHWQSSPQRWVPLAPQLRVAFGVHAP